MLAVFLCTMSISGGALAWLAWQFLEKDRQLESQRIQEKLEGAADRIAAAFEAGLRNLDLVLTGRQEPGGSVTLVLVKGLEITPTPKDGLLYLPPSAAATDIPEAVFAKGEELEFQRRNPTVASEIFRVLAASDDPTVRAGALLRWGRNLRKLGRDQEAPEAFRFGDAEVDFDRCEFRRGGESVELTALDFRLPRVFRGIAA
jgi:hypothetical protein